MRAQIIWLWERNQIYYNLITVLIYASYKIREVLETKKVPNTKRPENVFNFFGKL